MSQYDVVVIGAGPGGYVAAIRAAQLGLKTAVVEDSKIAGLGGVCNQWGCIPSKAILKNATVLHTIQHAEAFGITVDGVKADYSKAVDRSKKIVETQAKGVGFLFRKNKIDLIEERGRLAGKGKIKLEPSGKEITAKHIILATGARPRVFFDMKPDGKVVFTAKEFLSMRSVPSSMLVLGAGAIGMEFAYVLQNYGCQVTILEMADRLLPKEDAEVSTEIEKAFKKLGVKFHTKLKISKIEQKSDGVVVHATDAAGKAQTFEAPRLLSATGVMPNSENLGLQEAGVKTNAQGFIEVDEWMRTNVEGVYAIGDVTGKFPLAHVASAQGIACIEKIAGHHPQPLDYNKMPSATYCEPQVASIGLTEEAAKAKGHDVKVGKFPFRPNGKAQGIGEIDGFIKFVVDAKYGEILGIHMIGPEVTEMLGEASLAMNLEATAEDVDITVHAHPTLSEVFKEAALAAVGQPIHM